MADWAVGMEVECIFDGLYPDSAPVAINWPKKGQIYHIRGIRVSNYKMDPVCFLLDEIVNPFNEHLQREPDFFSRRFRRHVKLENNVFTKMLENIPQRLIDEETKTPEKITT